MDKGYVQNTIFELLSRLGIGYEKLEHSPIITMKEGSEIAYKINQFRTGYFCPKLILIHKHEKKDFKIHSQSAAFFLWFFHSRSYRFTLYSGLLYPVDVYPNYPTNHSWRRYKVETLLDT